ncbi:hypothetical protein [Paractinoplanes lichenicola]|uniref:Knr4/Smi1-like domain-containing protein n=1 Tax=Paractinoplanes lichenicola TaxID=2802976 RepID=A0ABS1W167_9ACTN|nr:hypothetical protein [Actinoplanes lichenicola]MBL7260480.1 hypothetical protein [Actinoplanes lichenicola]
MPLSPSDLVGYIETGLDADLARWFPDSPPVAFDEDVRPVEPFLARLSPADAAALAAFDRRVRSGSMPAFLDIADWVYGFDYAENECGILDSDYETELTDDDLWTVAADGSGSHYVVLTNGQVAIWFHEEEVIEAGTRFDNLDVFVWTMVRYRAVREGVLERADVEDDFRSLAQDGLKNLAAR